MTVDADRARARRRRGRRPRRGVGDRRPHRAVALAVAGGDFMTCPLLYRFRVVDRIPERPSRGGGARHRRAPGARGPLRPAGRASARWPRAPSLLPAAWDAVREPRTSAAADASCSRRPPRRPQEWLAAADAAARDLLPPRGPDARSSRPSASCGSRRRSTTAWCCAGTSTGSTATPPATLRVVDYKTGKAPGEGFEQKALFQMRFYALVLWRATGDRARGCCSCSTSATSRCCATSPTRPTCCATERKVKALWAAIQRAHETGDWRPNAVAPVRLVRPPVALPGVRRHSPAAARRRRSRPSHSAGPDRRRAEPTPRVSVTR